MRKQIPHHIKIIITLIVLIAPARAVTFADPFESGKPFDNQFVITGYYSPLPGQCCYVKGGLKADRILNGDGEIAADGSRVYKGMIAAPPNYPFGTVIQLHGIGTFMVHDRGGAIKGNRLDVWTGLGEEGLARALALGLQNVKGTVYPPGTSQPNVYVSFEDLPAPHQRLQRYHIEGHRLVGVTPSSGDRNYSVRMMQEYLRDLGYLKHSATGYYGEQTQRALAVFIRDFGLNASAEHLSDDVSAHLVAASKRKEADFPVSGYIEEDSSEQVIQEAQRLLRFLGYYRGRTDGQYSDSLFAAILKFQKNNYLVGTKDDPGAGRIGPLTTKSLQSEWNKKLVTKRAETYLDLRKIDHITASRGERLENYLGEGYRGAQVRLLQRLLAKNGYFPEDKINGNFGPLTKKSVLNYQLSHGIVKRSSDPGAGYVGPSTMNALRGEQKMEYFGVVRGEGWNAL